MSSRTSINRNIELLFEIGTLRHLDRVWKQFNGPHVANIAEHIFRVAWIALTIAKKEKVGDQEKILKMAIAHDVSESRAGDVHYLSRQYVERKEDMAVCDIFFGTIHEEEMIKLVREYEARKSIDAKIVKDADNLDVELELRELRYMGHTLGDKWVKPRKQNVYSKLYTRTAKDFWNAITKADPHDWHNRSPRNRFNSGDWRKKKIGRKN